MPEKTFSSLVGQKLSVTGQNGRTYHLSPSLPFKQWIPVQWQPNSNTSSEQHKTQPQGPCLGTRLHKTNHVDIKILNVHNSKAKQDIIERDIGESANISASNLQ